MISHFAQIFLLFTILLPSHIAENPSLFTILRKNIIDADLPPSLPRSTRTEHRSSSSVFSSSSRNSSSFASSLLPRDVPAPVIRSNLLLLGQKTDVVGAVSIFAETEPMDVRTLRLTLSPNVSVESVLFYDGDGVFLGYGSLSASAPQHEYTLTLPSNVLTIDQRETQKIYARLRLLPAQGGGVSGEALSVQSFLLEARGIWSSELYVRSTTEHFVPFETARARISSVASVGAKSGALFSGPGQTIGSFLFRTDTSDSTAKPALMQLRFTLQKSPAVSVTDISIGDVDGSLRLPCSISAGIVICDNLSSFGIIGNAGLRLDLHGSVVVASDVSSATFRLSLSESGTPFEEGSMMWTDGEGEFSWVGLPSPIAEGILLKQ